MTPGLALTGPSYVRARIIALAVAFGILAAVQAVYFTRGIIPGDAFTYLAAGERLNDGHPLYALSPGDRPVDLHPPFWTVPLLSPPPIAVLLRPFALLPGDVGAYAWWAVCLVALGLSILALARRKPITTAIAVGVLSIPIAYEIGVGNLNALVLAGLDRFLVLLRAGQGRGDGRGPRGGDGAEGDARGHVLVADHPAAPDERLGVHRGRSPDHDRQRHWGGAIDPCRVPGHRSADVDDRIDRAQQRRDRAAARRPGSDGVAGAA